MAEAAWLACGTEHGGARRTEFKRTPGVDGGLQGLTV